uniref:Uncharacterized protein n=1 Tax=Anopheles dirus TaxID=7168 RepID=A0A182NWS5_9DIPT
MCDLAARTECGVSTVKLRAKTSKRAHIERE